jgi:hypothetical protein
VRPEPPIPASWPDAMELVRRDNPHLSEPKIFAEAARRWPELQKSQITRGPGIRDRK